jgi:hypothetical protein
LVRLEIGTDRDGGATIQPTFQPVSEKILPAEPDLHRPLRHARHSGQWQMLAAIEESHAPRPRR